MTPGRIVTLVLLLLAFVALAPRGCAASLDSWVPLSLSSSQVMLPHRHTIQAPQSNWTPYDAPQIRFWWVDEDLATGAITNWVDRIQSALLTRSDGTGPVKDATGVYFSNSTNCYLTNNPSFAVKPDGINGQQSGMFIVRPELGSQTWGIIQAAGAADGSSGFAVNHGARAWFFSGESGSMTQGHWETNQLYDFAFTSWNTTNDYYTNGLSLFSTGLNNTWTNQASVGARFYSAAPTVRLPYKGSIREIMYFSNILSSVTLSNLHKYATNKYGYSP